MNRLIEIIGPAPSELPLEEFLMRLRGQRERTNKGLQAFRDGTAPTWRELRNKNWKQLRLDKAAKKKAPKKRAKRKKAPVQPSEEAMRVVLAERVESGTLPLEAVAQTLNKTPEETREWLKLPSKT